jgi:hypothetical protein
MPTCLDECSTRILYCRTVGVIVESSMLRQHSSCILRNEFLWPRICFDKLMLRKLGQSWRRHCVPRVQVWKVQSSETVSHCFVAVASTMLRVWRASITVWMALQKQRNLIVAVLGLRIQCCRRVMDNQARRLSRSTILAGRHCRRCLRKSGGQWCERKEKRSSWNEFDNND